MYKRQLLEGSWIDFHMISVEPVLPLLEGSCVLVSVASSRCPCLRGLRFLIPSDLVFAFSLGFLDRLDEFFFSSLFSFIFFKS